MRRSALSPAATTSARAPLRGSDHDPVYLTHVDPGRNMARFYTMSVQPTLFGECSVVREWGRIGTGGQVRETHHTTRRKRRPLPRRFSGRNSARVIN
ncbi:WGR domain-containing protein [Rhizobium sp. G21]|uniref:WGR domain-containing protein n=1 Tax=Rhizobium sp. G21 TaxID=2758439 RepID=UPI0016009A4C|nr:WGR domain-containing protein [Rhizobium sp. G21]MBB1251750.1 WGR domain-containing protein [Rhizobium sp. G21]